MGKWFSIRILKGSLQIVSGRTVGSEDPTRRRDNDRNYRLGLETTPWVVRKSSELWNRPKPFFSSRQEGAVIQVNRPRVSS